MGELIDELNQDKNVEKMIMSDMKIGDIYKERIQVNSYHSFRSDVKMIHNRNESKFMNIKRELFKLNKKFLEDFKNYQIIKLNILKTEDDFNEENPTLNVIQNPPSIQANSTSRRPRGTIFENSFMIQHNETLGL